MPKPKIPSFDWGKLDEALKDLPPEIRNRVEIPLRATNPRVFLMTLKTLRDQLNAAIEKLEKVTGDSPSTDSGSRGK